MFLSYLNSFFFNINGQPPAIQFVKLTKVHVPLVDHPHFFYLHRISCLSIPTVTQIHLIAWNIPCYLHLAFCLLVWLIKLKFTPYISHQDCFRESQVILRDWKHGSWSPDYDLWGGPDLKGMDLRPLFIPWGSQLWIKKQFCCFSIISDLCIVNVKF